VYGQVQALFKDAQDLLEEFKDFLPDIVGPGLASSGASAGMMPPSWPGDASPPGGSKKLPPTSKRKQKRGLEKDPTPGPSSTKGMIPNRVRIPILGERRVSNEFYRTKRSSIIICLKTRIRLICRLTLRRPLMPTHQAASHTHICSPHTSTDPIHISCKTTPPRHLQPNSSFSTGRGRIWIGMCMTSSSRCLVCLRGRCWICLRLWSVPRRI